MSSRLSGRIFLCCFVLKKLAVILQDRGLASPTVKGLQRIAIALFD
jgi:hypothetical protein